MIEGVFNTIMVFGLLLIAGVVIRELFPVFKKFMIPASLIGGFLGLILGQQVLGWVTIPVSFEEIPVYGMFLLMTCVPMGITITGKKMYQHLDFTFGNMTLYGAQIILGLVIGGLLISFWPGLPDGWGLLGVAAFFGAHGNVPIVSSVIDPTGELGAQSIGMVMATLGVLFAIIPGIIIANFGVRRGWGTFTTDLEKAKKNSSHRTLPEKDREPIGETTVDKSNVTALALQFGILAVSFKLGQLIFQGLSKVIPVLENVSPMLFGVIGSIILWSFMKKVNLDKYVDKKTIDEISNISLEAIILTACASIQLSMVSQFFIPLLILTIITCAINLVFAFAWFKKIGHPEWFEKALMVYGMATGSNPQGLAVVRTVDPDNQSSVYEAMGVYNAVFFWNFIILPIAASLVLVNKVPVYLIGFGLMIGTPIIAFILFSAERKRESKAKRRTASGKLFKVNRYGK